MADTLTRPIQVFLDTQRLIQTQPTGTRGPNKDFFAGNNAGFRQHKQKIQKQILDAANGLASHGDPAGFLMVQMREEGLGKSYRPLGALFKQSNSFALVGGAGIGQMYFQATPAGLQRLTNLIERRAEITPRVVYNEKLGREEERVSSYRSEVGAIDEIRLPTPSDRVSFSADEAVSWLAQENVIGGYVVELFRPDGQVTPDAVQGMVERFRQRLSALGGIVAVPFGARLIDDKAPTLTLSVDLRSDDARAISLPLLTDELDDILGLEQEALPVAPDRSVARHQALLDLLSQEPLVRRVDLPLRL